MFEQSAGRGPRRFRDRFWIRRWCGFRGWECLLLDRRGWAQQIRHVRAKEDMSVFYSNNSTPNEILAVTASAQDPALLNTTSARSWKTQVTLLTLTVGEGRRRGIWWEWAGRRSSVTSTRGTSAGARRPWRRARGWITTMSPCPGVTAASTAHCPTPSMATVCLEPMWGTEWHITDM